MLYKINLDILYYYYINVNFKQQQTNFKMYNKDSHLSVSLILIILASFTHWKIRKTSSGSN